MMLTPQQFSNKLLLSLPAVFQDELKSYNIEEYQKGVKLSLTTGEHQQYLTVKMPVFTYMLTVNVDTAEVKSTVYCAKSVIEKSILTNDYLYNVETLMAAFEKVVTDFRFVNHSLENRSDDLPTAINRLKSIATPSKKPVDDQSLAEIDG